MLKSIIKMIFALAIGVTVGFLVAGVFVVCFTDTTFYEFINDLMSTSFSESLLAGFVGLLAFVASMAILVPVHEAGHLVCGLLSGYKFVSFRIFNWIIIKLDGKLCVKGFAVAGTGGQCLLTPPDLPLGRIPTGWYNFGGILFNIIAVSLALPLLFIKMHPIVEVCVYMFILAGVFLILMNGIPMKISGAGNDGYNMIALNKAPLSKRGFVDALRANALIQEGARPKDMPSEWFIIPDNIDYTNQLEVSIPMMAASRFVDEMKYQDALAEFEKLYTHRDRIIPLFLKEIACELVFLRLVCGDIEGAKELLDKDLKTYVETFRKVMSSKERILCIIALILEENRSRAVSIYENLLKRKDEYLLQGEVKSDLAIMQNILGL